MSKQKQVGTAFETLVTDYLREHGWPAAARRAMQGALDKGDIYMPGEDRLVIECKRVTKMNLSGWHAEAVVEAANAGVPHGVVVHRRVGKGQAKDQWVCMSLETFCALAAPTEPF